MAHGYRVTLNLSSDVSAPAGALRAGSRAAERALSVFDAAMLRRLQPLACCKRSELEGIDYLDSSVLEYALFRALEAAFPETGGEPPPPLTRDCFVLRTTEGKPSEAAEVSPVLAEQPSCRASL